MDEATFKRLIENKNRKPDPMRYKNAAVEYRRAGNSGLKLPAVCLGLWQNFGSFDNFEIMRDMIFTAFDKGIFAFDLANNYGRAEEAPKKISEKSSKKIFPPTAMKWSSLPRRDFPCGQAPAEEAAAASISQLHWMLP